MRFCAPVVRTCLLLLIYSVAHPSISATNDSLPPALVLQATAAESGLHKSQYWHRLMHYYPSRFSSAVEGHVDDPRFYLANDGKHNPQTELAATIQSLFTRPVTSEITDFRCRFVERERWLRSELNLPAAPVPDACNEYHDWRGNIGSGSVTLVFPASYLNSPSSMFGHTLLRFDPEDISSGSPLLSWSLNFAADVGQEAMGAGYALKGIAGGYPGKFNSIPYFEKLQEYGAIENRDIWEYKLDLSTEEIDRILDHAWELREVSFDYFFFRQNCSFRLLELLDLARPELTLARQFPLTAIPADTVKAVTDANIVADIEYRPSLGSRLNHAIELVAPEHRHWISQIEKAPESTDNPQFKQLDESEQALIIRTANQLLTFRSRKSLMDDTTAKRRLQLLTQVSQLPTEENPADVPLPIRPETAHDTTTLSLARGRQDKQDFTEIGMRFSYHDVLDRNAGYSRGAGIVLGDIRVRKSDDEELRLQSFDVVKLQSFNDRFPQLNSRSWELTAGLSREPLLANDRIGARLDGFVGKSLRVRGGDIAYALLGASARQYLNPSVTFINAHARLGMLSFSRFGVSRLELAANSYKTLSLQTVLSVHHNLPIAKNHALRLEASALNFAQDWTRNFSLSYRFYF